MPKGKLKSNSEIFEYWPLNSELHFIDVVRNKKFCNREVDYYTWDLHESSHGNARGWMAETIAWNPDERFTKIRMRIKIQVYLM